MKKVNPFSSETLEAIARVLGDTDSGLKGSEIDYILTSCNIPNIDSHTTKWKRIFNAFVDYQNENQIGNHVIGFIHKSMNPISYTNNQEDFEWRREQLNLALSFVGLELKKDGKLKWVKKVSNLDEANKRAQKLKSELLARNVHNDVLKFCKAELVEKYFFHAVLEATKSIASKIRKKSGLKNDGSELVKNVFALGKENNPILAINNLNTKTEIGEQKAFVNLLIGLFGMFRNPTAHEPRIEWIINEEDALDILSIASLVHRKLDKTNVYKNKSFNSRYTAI